jgi:LPS export ABC transporter protein LptC
MRADSIVTLISDSGRIRYKVITASWLIYDQAPDPYWFFPEKIYFERFDDSMRIESIVKSDTARYFTKRKLWELKNNVQVMNLAGEKFETPLLYWDQNQHRIYSDSSIRIEQEGWISTGQGFESNESLTIYSILNSKGDFPLDPEEENTDN